MLWNGGLVSLDRARDRPLFVSASEELQGTVARPVLCPGAGIRRNEKPVSQLRCCVTLKKQSKQQHVSVSKQQGMSLRDSWRHEGQ